ncbi:MAG TPA: 4'-phosphopantetheinyl transferase superfamily protein [Bacteroidales bacterium]|nr:4'-phosphopantetheinyl transferase superfamily protein [Bacteroidales bacterium]HPT20309.1 4'-phosphopantetheinyl transferase superfamily protein [Bacteroidales bacterium]
MYPFTEAIECCFQPDTGDTALSSETETEVYFGLVDELCDKAADYEQVLSDNERSRADKFKFAEDRFTFITSHGFLRKILACKLGIEPSEIDFYIDENNKPWLEGDKYYFNISHTKNAFVIVLSEYYPSGIDIEYTLQKIDIDSVARIAFSEKERASLIKDQNLQDNFFRLWTRKEALLKAIGVGIIAELPSVEVSQSRNYMKKELLYNKYARPVSDKQLIYSFKVLDYFISVAVPKETRLKLIMINEINERKI